MRGALLGVVALVVALAGAAILLGPGLLRNGEQTPPPSASRTPRASVSAPTSTPVDRGIVAAANVVPRRSADLSMPVSGRVVEVAVTEEDEVFTGELLVRVDQSTRQAAVDVATADVERAEAAVERATLQVEQLPDDASPAQRESAAAELRLAEADLQVAQTALAQAELALAQTELRAPFAGTIAAVNVAEGEQAVADDPDPIVTIGDLSGWFIQTTDLSELDVVRVAVGDRAEVTFDALPDLTIGGTVDRIQVRGTAQPGSVRFDVFVRPDMHHPELRWNMSATVRILPED